MGEGPEGATNKLLNPRISYQRRRLKQMLTWARHRQEQLTSNSIRASATKGAVWNKYYVLKLNTIIVILGYSEISCSCNKLLLRHNYANWYTFTKWDIDLRFWPWHSLEITQFGSKSSILWTGDILRYEEWLMYSCLFLTACTVDDDEQVDRS